MGVLFLAAASISMTPPVRAQDARLDALEKRIAEQDQRIRDLEALAASQSDLLRRSSLPSPAPPQTPPPPFPAPPPAPAASSPAAIADNRVRTPGLDVGGDVRVRQEWNFVNGRDRSRTALRARMRAGYKIDDHFTLGAQIATGDPDDPNSTDVTLGNFVDDFQVSLDQAWVRYTNGGLTAFAGKFPQPFQRTDMLWDSDASPQGVGAAFGTKLGAARVDARGIWFIVDEASLARDSDMLGGQISVSGPLLSGLDASLAGSYYHYRLGAITGADAGDFRGNLMADGRYLSNFRLLEAMGTLSWPGFSKRWPLKLTADYVRNLGAAVPGDAAFNIELAAGSSAARGDWRISYTYSEVEVDAVLAAFSHDNIDLSTNYKLHGLGIGYVPAPHLQLDLLWYHYRPLDPDYASSRSPGAWLDRIRLAFMTSF